MARPAKPAGEVARIESEIAVLKTKLADHEHRHADALAALEQGRENRRKLLTTDDAAVQAATKKIRDLQFTAEDAGALVVDYQAALADAERRLVEASAADRRESAAAILNAIAENAAAHAVELTAAVENLMGVRAKLMDAIPTDVGLLPSHYARRPDDRPEGSSRTLSPREIVNAVVAEALCYGDETMFDREYRTLGSKVCLSRLLEIDTPQPTYAGEVGPALSPADAINALIVKPAKARADQILAGETEPVLDDIKIIDRSKPPEVQKIEIIATKPLYFIAPTGDGYFRHHLSEGRTETVIEPIARLAIAKRAALEFQSDAGQAFRADFEERLTAGRVAREPRSDTVDLGDPMGCLSPANDDEIAQEVDRALG